MILSIDIETYSDINIKNGVYKYVDSPEFKILLFAYSYNFGEVNVIDLTKEKLPEDILEDLKNPEIEKSAFNAQFERVCLNRYFNIESKNWFCSMIQANACGISGGLGEVGKFLNLETEKMKEGKDLIKIFSDGSLKRKPKSVTGTKEKDWELFKEYCKKDVEVEIEIRASLDKFDQFEKEFYTKDQEINDRGFELDKELIKKALQFDSILKQEAQEKAQKLGVANPKSPKQIKDFIKEKTGEEIKSLDKRNMETLKSKFTGEALEILKIRETISNSSISKYQKMADIINRDNRARGCLQFYGASKTGRWAGRLIQVQNLPRIDIKNEDEVREDVKNLSYEDFKEKYEDVGYYLTQTLRSAIIPKEGYKFIISDFSAIEARVIAWYAGEDWVLEVFRTTGKIYEETASKMYNIPVEEITKDSPWRQKGKTATLSLGYQGSRGALIAQGALKQGIKEEELMGLVKAWRAQNPKIVNLWYDCERAVIDTVKNYNINTVNKKIKTYTKRGVLFIELANGRRLAYQKPRIERDPKFNNDGVVYTNGKRKDRLYGGLIVENIVQATARDLLAEVMMRSKYDIVFHVHDEIVVEVPKKLDKKEIHDIMLITPDWAEGLPLDASTDESEYYTK